MSSCKCNIVCVITDPKPVRLDVFYMICNEFVGFCFVPGRVLCGGMSDYFFTFVMDSIERSKDVGL